MLDRYFGCVFGENKQYYFPADNEGLERCLNIASAIDAKGIEVRFDGPIDVRSKRTIIAGIGPTLKDMEKITKSIIDLGFKLNLHMSKYSAAKIFDRSFLDFEESNEFERITSKVNKIITHPHYEESFIKRLEDQKLKEILEKPFEERASYKQAELFSEEYKNKILIENGKRPKSTLQHTLAFAEKYDIGMVLDIGHFVGGFYRKVQGKKIDDIRRYNNTLINYMGNRIVHAHVQGARKIASGQLHTHYPFDDEATLTDKQEEILFSLLSQSNLESYTIEIWRGIKGKELSKFLESCENFENKYQEALKLATN